MKCLENHYLNDASWIWIPEKKQLQNCYVAFRLMIEDFPASNNTDWMINVSAVNLYLLYVNGVYLGRGPVRAWKEHIGIDTYMIGKHLVPGKNIISVLVTSYGVDIGVCQLSRPGFLLEGSFKGISFSTGVAHWQACLLNYWDSSKQRISANGGFSEDLDMNLYNPAVWQKGDDNADWRKTVIISDAEKHWPHREKRMIPMLRETCLDSMKLVAVGELVSTDPELAARKARMAEEIHRRISPERMRLTKGQCPIEIMPGDPAYLIFDVQRMTSGVVEFEIKADGSEELCIGYVDGLRFVDGQPFLEKRDSLSANPMQNTELILNPKYSGVDRFVLKKGLNKWRGHFNINGFRYIKMSFSGLKSKLEIRYVRACEITYPVKMTMNFHCSDQQLNSIWEAGRLTTRLCMSDVFMDNPNRERQQYGGDGSQVALYAYYYFGDTKLWRQLLHMFPQGMREDKAIQSGGPWPFNQIITTSTLMWVESIRQYVYYTGDSSVLREYAGKVIEALEWFSQFEAEDGLLTEVEKRSKSERIWSFIDWQLIDGEVKGEEARLCLNAFYYSVLNTAAWIMDKTDRKDKAVLYRNKRQKLARAFRKVANDEQSVALQSEHVISYASYAGLVSGQMKKVAARILEKKSITEMYNFFMLKALEKENCYAAIIAFIRNVLGKMLDDGSTTLYEVKARDARYSVPYSLCQGVAGFCGYFMPRTITGIKEILFDQKIVVLQPNLGDIEWAQATVPCVDGEIKVSVRNKFPGVNIETTVPDGWSVKINPHVEVESGNKFLNLNQ